MVKKIIPFSIFYILCIPAFSQTEAEKQEALEYGKKGIELMDNGQYDESIELLDRSVKLDPENYIYPYELGYAYILKEEYKTAIQYFESVVKMKGSNDQCYQMLGNAYSMGGDRDKAIDAYNRGLKLYPNSGRLYLELGNVHQNDWNQALEYYEKGAELDPGYPSNYYWLAKIFCNSTEEMWGMMYGEIFMNIERGSQRTEEISKLLYDTYSSEISFTSDTSATVSFSENIVFSDSKKKSLPYSLIYEPTLLLGVTSIDTISLESLNTIRTEFTLFHFDRKFNKSYPNVLFDWHHYLIETDKFECYNYWLLNQGAPYEFDSWYAENSDRFDEFIQWFTNNPMKIDDENNFHRSDY